MTPPPAGALHGIRVIDMSRLAPGPLCSMMLADLGAEVIVVGGGRSGLPLTALCRGKRFISLDLKRDGGRAALHRLVSEADVLLEGFRPGVADRLGAGYAELSAVNPRLVYCSLTGYGQDGPLATTAGHDINYLALSGLLGAVGPVDGPPLPPLNLLADYGGGGMLAAFGIVSALLERERSGRGQHVDAAMVDGVVAMMVQHYSVWGQPTLPDRGRGLLGGEAPFYRCYKCADGRYVAVGALEDAFFRALWDGLGLGDCPQHMSPSAWPQIEKVLSQKFLERTRDEWAEHFEGTDACVTAVLAPDEVHGHPQIRARHGALAFPEGPPVPLLSRTPGVAAPAEPADQTEAVLGELGLDAEHIAAALPDGPRAVQGLTWPPI
ncbi:CaiB/BaiF CoA-transferase family protein [Pseudonocardia sp. MH-G8]|uniref:CaiB/BaiF CoA transferase family protein n=1 Tax=Pseudonocardia sp. MH-G8 TaxID=1854588 RepID=UPI001E5070CC|nr:CaiB/BaiF CoA-transferase family protein [Pseudonocardia sp. MH-G8]